MATTDEKYQQWKSGKMGRDVGQVAAAMLGAVPLETAGQMARAPHTLGEAAVTESQVGAAGYAQGAANRAAEAAARPGATSAATSKAATTAANAAAQRTAAKALIPPAEGVSPVSAKGVPGVGATVGAATGTMGLMADRALGQYDPQSVLNSFAYLNEKPIGVNDIDKNSDLFKQMEMNPELLAYAQQNGLISDELAAQVQSQPHVKNAKGAQAFDVGSDPNEISVAATPINLPPVTRPKSPTSGAVDEAVDTAFGAANGKQWKGAGGYEYAYNPKTKAITIMADPTGRATGKTFTQGSAYDAILAEGMKKGAIPMPSASEVVSTTTRPNPLPGAPTEKALNFDPGAPMADATVGIGSAGNIAPFQPRPPEVAKPAPVAKAAPPAPPAPKAAPGSAPAAAAVTPSPEPAAPKQPAMDAPGAPMPSPKTAPSNWADWYASIRRPATAVAAEK